MYLDLILGVVFSRLFLEPFIYRCLSFMQFQLIEKQINKIASPLLYEKFSGTNILLEYVFKNDLNMPSETCGLEIFFFFYLFIFCISFNLSLFL